MNSVNINVNNLNVNLKVILQLNCAHGIADELRPRFNVYLLFI